MAEIDTLIEIAKKRRSIRKFRRDHVPDEYLEKIVETARWAASGSNTQPWEFIVIKEQATKNEIANIFAESLEDKRERDKKFPFGPVGKAEKLLMRRYTDPPVLLVVCSDPRCKDALPKQNAEEILHVSMGAAMEHIHLAATTLGLGCAWGSVDEEVDRALKQLLGIPVSLRTLEVFSIGYPDMEPIPKYCRPLEEVLHYERFDTGKWRKDHELNELIATRKFPDIYSGSANK